MLLKKEYEQEPVEEANNAYDGIQWLGQYDNDDQVVIILDIRMPEVDGFGFVNMFQDLPVKVKDRSEIIMLSSSRDPNDVKRARESNHVLDILEKPLNPEMITSILAIS